MRKTPPEESFIAVAGQLAGRASQAAEVEVGAPFDERLAECVSLARHRELGLALEILCSNLDEYRITVSEDEYGTIKSLAQGYGLDDKYWEWVRELVTRPDS